MASNFRFEEISGGDLTIERNNLRRVRRFRSLDTLPATFSGDYFDQIAGYALSWVTANAATYQTPWGFLPYNSIQIHENHYALNYEITVDYAPFGETGQESGAGAYQISVDTSGGTVHVTSGKCIAIYPAANGPADLVGEPAAIGERGDTVEGVDLPIAEPKINVMFRHPTAFLTRNYVRAIGKLVGFPNSDTFLGYAAGEVVYLGGLLTETNTESSASYSFAISYNRTNFEVAGITITDKKGWDILDPIFKKDPKNGKPTTVVDYFKVVRPADREWKAYKSVFGWGA